MTCHPDPDILSDMQLHNPVFADQSGIATVWKVQRQNGQNAALKIYTGRDPKDEAPGFDYLRAKAGEGAVHVYHYADGVALLEWLDGPSLGDMTRAGDDAQANRLLLDVATRMHAKETGPISSLPRLADRFADLFVLNTSSDWSDQTQRCLNRAQGLARSLLDDQRTVCPLHGDLHHDNIKQGPRGYVAFDAKGVIGDRGYELANAFRNPIGADGIVHDPLRAHHLAQMWGQAFGVAPHRLLSWACAHAALSLAWDIGKRPRPDTTLLAMLFDVLDQTA